MPRRTTTFASTTNLVDDRRRTGRAGPPGPPGPTPSPSWPLTGSARAARQGECLDLPPARAVRRAAQLPSPRAGDRRTARSAGQQLVDPGAGRGHRRAAPAASSPPAARSAIATIVRRSRTTAWAPSRSALLTTNRSPTSRMPAFAAWMPSPIPGATRTSVTSASTGDLHLGLADTDRLHHDGVASRRRRRPAAPAGRRPPARRDGPGSPSSG